MKNKSNCCQPYGMLVKRPILVGGDIVLVGFKENEWREKLL
jgi:arsenate reductase